MLRSVVLAALLMGNLGCHVDASPDRFISPLLSGQAGGGVLLTGAGHTDLPISGDMRNFTFHVRKDADGNVSGGYRVHRHDIDAWFTVDATCMEVVGNTAWVGGIIADTNVPNIIRVGAVSYFFATDDGEGAGAADRVSRARTNDAAGQDRNFCNLKPTGIFDPNPLTILQGNVQLR